MTLLSSLGWFLTLMTVVVMMVKVLVEELLWRYPTGPGSIRSAHEAAKHLRPTGNDPYREERT